MLKPRKSLLNSDAGKAIRKPQNQISETAKEKAICEMVEWFKDFELPGYQARLLASEMIDRAISERIKATHPTAADVYISDADKVFSLVLSAKKIATDLDEKDELESLLAALEKADSQGEGNSI